MDLTKYADVCGTDKGTHQGFMQYYPKYLPHTDYPVCLLELGVYQGASLKLWSKYFTNPNAEIFGIDIDFSQCDPAVLDDARVYISTWDQADPKAVEWYPRLDVIIDDASHISSKTIASFHTWWPEVEPGGVYVVEDTHCSYNMEHYGPHEASKPEMDTFGGNYERTPRTTMAFLKRLADDVNWNYHGYDRFNPLYQDIEYVHFYPGITFIGKRHK